MFHTCRGKVKTKTSEYEYEYEYEREQHQKAKRFYKIENQVEYFAYWFTKLQWLLYKPNKIKKKEISK